jgi:hypothetical protein
VAIKLISAIKVTFPPNFSMKKKCLTSCQMYHRAILSLFCSFSFLFISKKKGKKEKLRHFF